MTNDYKDKNTCFFNKECKNREMATLKNVLVMFIFVIVLSSISLASVTNGGYLYPQFYDRTCPKAQEIVRSIVAKAHAQDPRMAASLLRLHFHDCFVKGCDASILLDNSGTIISEKRSNPNKNSVRGFEVVDEIKYALERECPETVSCADILALAARDSTVLTGGPSWEVPLGRRDSLGASLSGHTIGDARCTSFRQRLYNQSGNGLPDATLSEGYAAELRTRCPRSGGDQTLFFLDPLTPLAFDNLYFKSLLTGHGLLSSDELLVTQSAATRALVAKFVASNEAFFEQFAKSVVKMGNISPLTGPTRGEIRTNCRKINGEHY
ncbi:Peroxidase 72 [Ananas comosus]|uniref:Peroxidase n=1 Tax=Ananas comosus TaxID=4615 RepID=A0A199W325_ANACO|nr:Peroxidase 72 [Ananas comosus]